MGSNDDRRELVDLGDAVIETRGSAAVGLIDPLGGYRQQTGLESDD